MGTAFPTVHTHTLSTGLEILFTHTKHWSGDFIKYFLETADSQN